MRENLVVFDFDGTLTTSDSFVRFALRSVGKSRFAGAVFRCAPYLAAWKCRLISGGRAKERLFAALYAGHSREWLLENGRDFARDIARLERPETVKALERHIADGDNVYIVDRPMGKHPFRSRRSCHSHHLRNQRPGHINRTIRLEKLLRRGKSQAPQASDRRPFQISYHGLRRLERRSRAVCHRTECYTDKKLTIVNAL